MLKYYLFSIALSSLISEKLNSTVESCINKIINNLPAIKFKESKKKTDDSNAVVNKFNSNLELRSSLSEEAKKHIGIKYVWSGKKPGGFDCSGFTSYVMKTHGISVSPSSKHQALEGIKIKIEEAMEGDLIVFSKNRNCKKVTHVAMVLKNDQEGLVVIHACSRGITIDNITKGKIKTYWEPKILYAINVIDKHESNGK